MKDQSRDPLWPFKVDWEKAIAERFPNGVEPAKTPFFELLKNQAKPEEDHPHP